MCRVAFAAKVRQLEELCGPTPKRLWWAGRGRGSQVAGRAAALVAGDCRAHPWVVHVKSVDQYSPRAGVARQTGCQGLLQVTLLPCGPVSCCLSPRKRCCISGAVSRSYCSARDLAILPFGQLPPRRRRRRLQLPGHVAHRSSLVRSRSRSAQQPSGGCMRGRSTSGYEELDGESRGGRMGSKGDGAAEGRCVDQVCSATAGGKCPGCIARMQGCAAAVFALASV